ncbi:hypothetical protein PF003_g26911 [Phytophthora fragariae]|nr:hypothetical protein PF003_g26911 [Phytophthora fragariae]
MLADIGGVQPSRRANSWPWQSTSETEDHWTNEDGWYWESVSKYEQLLADGRVVADPL